MNRHTAVFDSSAQAEAAITELRRMGVADAHLSFVGRHDGQSAPVMEGGLGSGANGQDANGWHDGDTMNGTTSGGARLASGSGVHGSDERSHNINEGTGRGLLTGAGVGALFGLAAAAIPGVGPFVSAGVLASTLGVAGGAAAAGAVVGGAAGSLAGALTGAGYSQEQAERYGAAVERGGVLVAVEDAGIADATVIDVLQRHGGHVH